VGGGAPGSRFTRGNQETMLVWQPIRKEGVRGGQPAPMKNPHVSVTVDLREKKGPNNEESQKERREKEEKKAR